MNGAPIPALPVFQPFSPEATAISHLFAITLAVCAAILAVVIGIIGVSLLRFRQRPGAGEPPVFFGNRKLEIFWTAVPTLIVAGLFVLTARGMRESDPPANRDPDLIVIGHQFWWEVRYPGTSVVTANEIHLSTGRPCLVRLESADVIHDFWALDLARKIQVIPGQTNYLWLEAALPGTYAGSCAEYCGAQHAWMRFSVIAESPAAFAEWLGTEQAPAAPPADTAPGRKIFQSMTCVNCHSLRGISAVAGAAPDLTHLAARQVLGAGVLANTKTNLVRWLKDPQAIKPGCLMPNLNLTDAQAGELADYLEDTR